MIVQDLRPSKYVSQSGKPATPLLKSVEHELQERWISVEGDRIEVLQVTHQFTEVRRDRKKVGLEKQPAANQVSIFATRVLTRVDEPHAASIETPAVLAQVSDACGETAPLMGPIEKKLDRRSGRTGRGIARECGAGRIERSY